jgi:sugar/nucleoside kinase (ribokinase family)
MPFDGLRTTTSPGGGFNVMATATRLGVPVSYAGAHGTGPFATQARLALDEAGIELLHPAKEGLDTGFAVTLVDEGGERTFVTSRGAEATLSSDDLDRVRPTVRELVYLSGYGLLHDVNRTSLIPWLRTGRQGVLVRIGPAGCVDAVRGVDPVQVPGARRRRST